MFKINSRVSEISFFGFLAKSLKRLWAATITIVFLTVLYGKFLSHFLLDVSEQVGLNILLLTIQFIFVIFSGYVVAMLAGSLIFGDRWRRQALLHEKIELTEVESDSETLGNMLDNALPFYGLIIVGTILTYILLSISSQNYLTTYNQRGFFRTLLRSDLPADQIQGLRAVVDPNNRAAGSDGQIRELIASLVLSREPEVQLWAAWAIGHLQIVEARDGLRVLLDSNNTPAQVESALALGRLADPLGERHMIGMLSSNAQNIELISALLRGLGLTRSTEATTAIAALLSLLPHDQKIIALWTLAQSRDTSLRLQILGEWNDQNLYTSISFEEAMNQSHIPEEQTSFLRGAAQQWANSSGDPTNDLIILPHAENLQRQCAVAEALKYVSTVDDDAMLRRVFRETSRALYCNEIAWDGRSYKDNDRFQPILMVIGESLRMKYLKAVFNIADRELEEWLVDIAWDEFESNEMRVMADLLAEQVRSGTRRLPRE